MWECLCVGEVPCVCFPFFVGVPEEFVSTVFCIALLFDARFGGKTCYLLEISLTWSLPSSVKINSFGKLMTNSNPRLRRFNRLDEVVQ